MKFMNLDRCWKKHETEFLSAITKVGKSGNWVSSYKFDGNKDDHVELLADAIRKETGYQYVLPCSSGTDALYLALSAHGIIPGSEVVSSVFTFGATAEVVRQMGAYNTFKDINTNFLMDYDFDHSESTRAVVTTSLFGLPYFADHDYGGVAIIEDGCQCFGSSRCYDIDATYVTSFYPTKSVGTIGEGGVLCTNDWEVYDKALRLVNHGISTGIPHTISTGGNYRMSQIQAAIILVRMRHMGFESEQRAIIANRYNDGLPSVGKPVIDTSAGHTHSVYTIRHPQRDKIKKSLEDSGIPSAIYYPRPLNWYPGMGDEDKRFPMAERACGQVLSLPICPYMSLEEVDQVIKGVNKVT